MVASSIKILSQFYVYKKIEAIITKQAEG